MRDVPIEGAAGGFQREAVPQACGLRNGLSGRQDGVHLPQRGKSARRFKAESGRGIGFMLDALAAFSVRMG